MCTIKEPISHNVICLILIIFVYTDVTTDQMDTTNGNTVVNGKLIMGNRVSSELSQ